MADVGASRATVGTAITASSAALPATVDAIRRSRMEYFFKTDLQQRTNAGAQPSNRKCRAESKSHVDQEHRRMKTRSQFCDRPITLKSIAQMQSVGFLQYLRHFPP